MAIRPKVRTVLGFRIASAALTALAALALPAAPAQAHGPCNCSFPQLGKAGTRVTIRSAAYKVIVNPRRSDFTLPPGGLESAYRPGAPRLTVLSRPRTSPLRRTAIRIPQSMPPGVYLLLIFDGSEGGVHYTWDYFHVLGEQASLLNRDDDSEGPLWYVWAAAGAGGALLAVAAVRQLRRSNR